MFYFFFLIQMKSMILSLYIKAIQLLMSTFTSKYKSTPTFSFKGWTKSVTSYNDPSFTPSPQDYNPEKISINKSPSARFPKSTRRQWDQVKSKEFFPGPGAHQSISYTTSGLKKTISKIMFKKEISKTPSPGQYNPKENILKKNEPSFTMQKKTISMHDLIASKNLGKPSPVNYEQPIIKFRSSSSITMAKSLRKSPVLPGKIPGPGSYETQKSFNSSILSESKCKIGKQKRKIDFSIGQKTPGPGSYQKKSFIDVNKLKSRGYSCRAKFEPFSPLEKIPGPGQYETPIIKKFKSAPKINMPKSVRISFTDKAVKIHSFNPGPAGFDIEGVDRVKFRSMSVHKFSKSKSNYLSDSINSQSSPKLFPGMYNANEFFLKKSSPKFSISQNPNRGLFTKMQKLPGPGQYNPKPSLLYQSQHPHKIEQSQRSNPTKHLASIPGPGQYSPLKNDSLGVRFKFSKQKRQQLFTNRQIKKKSLLHQTYEEREIFPNPPKYMSVISKLNYEKKGKK